tara:strand:- start:219 stop:329 length:111 start_codon:yes stop_codon:yes gene_type:complete
MVIQEGNQITNFYSKKSNPILGLQVKGNTYFPKREP